MNILGRRNSSGGNDHNDKEKEVRGEAERKSGA